MRAGSNCRKRRRRYQRVIQRSDRVGDVARCTPRDLLIYTLGDGYVILSTVVTAVAPFWRHTVSQQCDVVIACVLRRPTITS